MPQLILILFVIGIIGMVVEFLFQHLGAVISIIIVIIVINEVIKIIFWYTHRHPLSDAEIEKLSKKRISDYKMLYFNFHPQRTSYDPKFKSSLNPNGKMYQIFHKMDNFPSYVSALLKGKKHEWYVLGFCTNNNEIKYLWANKGDDNSSVGSFLTIENIKQFCLENNIKTVLEFHNHPNSHPQYYNCLIASNTDKEGAKEYGQRLNEVGINFIAFVCERGNFIEYHKSFSDDFCPDYAKIDSIKAENGKSEQNNYNLHCDLHNFIYKNYRPFWK